MPNRAEALLALALLGVALPALAGDGRVEINQARALAGGITPGDTANFPITLNSSASYVLTGNLTVTDPNVDGITITVDDVSLDLNGFTIAGPATCNGSGSTLTCSVGSGRGVDADLRSRIKIWNGRVRGFPGLGVAAGEQAEIRDLVMASNGAGGLSLGTRSRIHGVTADRNEGSGILVQGGSRVDGGVASSNFAHGIQTGGPVVMLGCNAYDNGGLGFSASGGAVVRDSSAYANDLGGILVGSGALVSDSSAYTNGGDGVETFSGSTVQRTTMRTNAGFGLTLGADSTYRENTITGNAAGTVTGPGVNMGSNSCDGALACP